MNHKKLLLITGCFILILTSFRVLWLQQYGPTSFPKAESGVLDLRGFDYTDETIPLNGDWMFYPRRLLTPDSPKSKSVDITLPGDWKSYFDSNSDNDDKDYLYGTFRLRILLDPSKQMEPYTFYMKDIHSASNVFINGRNVTNQGTVATSRDEYRIGARPFFVTIDSDIKEIDVFIQIADTGLSRIGGIKEPVQFGYSKNVMTSYTLSIILQILSASILLLHFLFALIIYFGFSRKLEMFYLAIVFGSAAISILMDDDRILLTIFPNISTQLWMHLFSLSYVTSVIFMMLVFKRLLDKSIKKRMSLTVAYYTGLGLYISYIVMRVFGWFTVGQYIFSFLMLTVPLVIAVSMFFLVKDGTSGVIFLLLAVVSIANSIGWATLKTNSIVVLPYYPFDIMIAVLLFAVFWFKQFFKATKESQALAKRLQRISDQKDEFLANTSHELRNPLHGIMNISQTIYETEVQLSEESKKNMETLITVSKRMSYILNDLMDAQRLKEKGIQLQLEQVDLCAVVTSVVDALKFMTEGKDIQFRIEIPKDFPYVIGDENRLFQIVFNLVHNAVKFTGFGEIVITGKTLGNTAEISVADTGIGMNPEVVESVFHAYEQADSSITALGGGLGLGLSICEQLVHLHDGTIRVQSELGQGSVFTFTLPTGNARYRIDETMSSFATLSTSHETELSLPNNSGSGAQILVVDDDSINRSILKQILQTNGFVVTTCSSGAQALDCIEEKKWNLVITDVMMPEMSGYELCGRIRKRYSTAQLPILLLTARSEPEDVKIGFQYGANDHVRKPVDRIELVARVQALTDLQKSMNERTAMEAAWLQAQIKPHFLFNTLNAIAALSDDDPDKMMRLIDQFGTYLNSSFSTQNLDQLVPLENELRLVKSYIYIEQQRFGERLKVGWNVSVQSKVMVPPLAIQTLVENAIVHGVLCLPEGGTVTIAIVEYSDRVTISIKDNGIGMNEEKVQSVLNPVNEQEKGIGLLNTDKRLKQLFGIGLVITSEVSKGTTLSFSIPI
ncbi:hybrid sensor histidine kinase/response regulator [Sporosarcina aquimarina]|uniref:histidine kinase n=1 Tax=Sporosarcina aquimarina TaxID=114975 RepID=A0ABU4G2C7_9BACL|nr:ATP-binding protein [Sporosarcina aquimarina]MDW0109807.1 ATP-binding protein [Sporosarcina aquimarina]